MEVSQSFISKLHCSISNGLPHAEPVSTFRTDEHQLVQGVLQMLQGFASSLFYWNGEQHSFFAKHGIFVSHLSQTSLSSILNRFLFIGSCLKKVEIFTKKVKASKQRAPTLEAFTDCVFLWLKRLRDTALEEEKFAGSDSGMTITLQGLTNSLSRLLSGAECLFKIVDGAIPSAYFDTGTPIPASEIAVHILDYLFKELNEICLIQDGEEEPYHMVLAIFTGSLLPYLKGLDSWLYEGILDDPYEEMFFSANDSVTIDQPSFWERSYLPRPCKWRNSTSSVSVIPTIGDITLETRSEIGDQKQSSPSGSARGRDQLDVDIVVCPLFLKEMARAIVSAGKSLQLVRHVMNEHAGLSNKAHDNVLYDFGITNYQNTDHAPVIQGEPGNSSTSEFKDERLEDVNSDGENHSHFPQNSPILDELTLSEVFILSLSGLICGDTHMHDYFEMSYPEIAEICEAFVDRTGENALASVNCEKSWLKFLANVIPRRSFISVDREIYPGKITINQDPVGVDTRCESRHHNPACPDFITACLTGTTLSHSFCPESPVITVCREFLKRNSTSWNNLNISRNFHLPPLNDEKLREMIFGEKCVNASVNMDLIKQCTLPRLSGTDYNFGFHFGEFGRIHLEDEAKTMETLFPFPTLLPCLKEDLPISELLPSQKNSALASSILNWIQNSKPKETPLPAVIIQECLSVYIKKQLDHVGKHILSKLMNDWKLMDELCVLRAIFLLGSGDLLQEFLIVIFDKLDKGDSWDDDFELNTMLQESIRNSADGSLLSASDSLVVSIGKSNSLDDEDHATGNLSTHKIRNGCFGVDALDVLKFSYKVSWPLDLIANTEAINKYNQVMGFLLKVKRAKFVLDKARRWMWKGRGGITYNYKRHLLLEQKLLHFVDAFHQYVMDRVFHSSWIELCSGMATAGSLDEVIEVHEAYLLSVQRQCFVAPDKLWALIASRIKSILGLALDFYSIQQTLSSGGAAPTIKARCEMEVDRIEKQFDDCIAFLLRILSFKLNVGHFPHLADLVTRINYNYFYMSDNGNLLTVPSFESSTAKLSKMSATRTE